LLEDAARQWAAAVLSKLRLEVDKQKRMIRMQLKLLYREAIRAGLGTESSDEAAVTQLSGALFISW
jgi:hypothetical protein